MASDAQGFTPSIINTPIKLPSDFDGQPQDLYIVFVNKDGGESQSLMVVMGIEFKMTK